MGVRRGVRGESVTCMLVVKQRTPFILRLKLYFRFLRLSFSKD